MSNNKSSTKIGFDKTVLSLFKRFLLIVLGSGLFTNALYLYGLSYYEGLISRMGFEYALFSISWDEAIFWAYLGSREIGASTLNLFSSITTTTSMFFIGSFYLISRLWVALDKMDLSEKELVAQQNNSRKLIDKMKKTIVGFIPHWLLFFFKPIKWLIMSEQAVVAFFASYFFMIFLFFIPLFLILWIYFPVLGFEHGNYIGELHSKKYQENLCENKKYYWNQCITFNTSHLKLEETPKKISGILVFNNDEYFGVITKDGPITLTKPTYLYYASKKNKNYKSKKDSSLNENIKERD